MSDERESRVDSCVECCVRDNDFSEKMVYQCELCGRWFCGKHSEPRLAFIKSQQAIDESSEVRMLLYTEMQREDGHPDFEYSRRKFAELDIEEKRRNELIEQALDRMNAHYTGRSAESFYVCSKCGAQYTLHEKITYCTKCGSPVKRLPYDIAESKRLMEELEPYGNEKETKPKARRSIPVKKIVAVSMILVILGVFLWYSPTIVSMIQNYLSQNPPQSSYTKLTLMKDSSPSPNFTTLTFGDLDYSFSYVWQNNRYFLLVGNSILEGKSYLQPTNGSVYRDIGIEIKVSEVHSSYIVIFVKPNVQDYLVQSSFKKLTIAQGQGQGLNFSGNIYALSYNYPTLTVINPSFQTRQYSLAMGGSQIINCDLGLEIRVYKATSQYIIIFVKSTY